MKIAFILSDFTCPRQLDFNNTYTNDRGLTGSDLGIIRTAEEFVIMGHDTYLFCPLTGNQQEKWKGVKLFPIQAAHNYLDDSFDTFICWNDPNPLFDLPTKPIRLVASQLNRFGWCKDNFDDFVDIWTSPSEIHMEYQKSFNLTDPNKWSVVPNGCDPEVYDGIEKVPGRVIWASSADRGLHLLLQEWPEIKKAVPHATLKVFYNFDFGDINKWQKSLYIATESIHMEIMQRARYMIEMMARLKPLGVEHVGSVSRERINKEMGEAEVLAFPCSSTIFTEGFSVATLESCAAKSCPVISGQDALKGIYKDVVPMVNSPAENNIKEFTALTIRALTDETYRNSINEKCSKFASNFTWPKIAKKYENLIKASNKNQNRNDLVKLNIGAGPSMFPYTGWINYDREDFNYYSDYLIELSKAGINTIVPCLHPIVEFLLNGNKLDMRKHDLRSGFPQHADNSVDLIYFGQVIEHINPLFEAPKLMKEFYRMLKPGGVARIVTPDLNVMVSAYINNEMDKFSSEQPPFYQEVDASAKLSYLMFGSAGEKCTWDYYEGHMFIYTKDSMNKLLSDAGFNGPFNYYYETGKSISPTLAKESTDQGMTHSFIVEAVK